VDPAIQDRIDTTYFLAYLQLRGMLLDKLSDSDLAKTLGGTTRPLGELCRKIGETEQDYIDSFRNLKLAFEHRHPDPTIETSVDRLREWFDSLDRDLMAALEGLTAEDVARRSVQRGDSPGDFDVTPLEQLEIYREALLGFAVGYEDPTFFRRLFRRTTGMTPAAYRRKYTGIGSGAAPG
jgi:Bacterial regulatory helix-turn-helix proteins, AraC family/DinB superfamily